MNYNDITLVYVVLVVTGVNSSESQLNAGRTQCDATVTEIVL